MKRGVTGTNAAGRIPVQFTMAHNIVGPPAVSLPTARHSFGLSGGVQLAAASTREDLALQLVVAIEYAVPLGQALSTDPRFAACRQWVASSTFVRHAVAAPTGGAYGYAEGIDAA